MLRFLACALLSLALSISPASAQNAFSATYDTTRQVQLKGLVTRIDWTNPHAFLFIKVADSAGANWAVEIGNPLDLEADGWKRTTVHVGDSVAVDGIPARGMKRQAFAKSVTTGKSNTKIFTAANRRPTAAKEPAPRWPDGRVSLGPPAGKKGYWGRSGANALVETAAGKIPMNDEGLLVNLSDIDRVAPLQPWARAVYEYRQRTLLKDDPFVRCLPPGGPRQFHTPHGVQFVEQKDLGRILVLLGGGNRNWRAIYTDGRAQGQAEEAVRGYYGTSVGKWEGDVLSVDTIGFNEKFWFSNGGLPHTEALHLIERFTRPDLGTLQYEVTVDDPRAYTRSWKSAWTLQWVPNEEIQEYFCEENSEATFVR